MIRKICLANLIVMVFMPGVSVVAVAQNKDLDQKKEEKVYSATLMFDDQEIRLSGKSTYADLPASYSFFLEQSGSIRCGIHVMGLEKGLDPGVYQLGTENSPKTGAVCLRHDEEVRERISSRSGQFVIHERGHRSISGLFEIQLKGDVSGIEYSLQGEFVAQPIR